MSKSPFLFRTRRNLVAAVIALQAVVIGIGWQLTVRAEHKSVTNHTLDEVLEERRKSVERFAALLEDQVGARLEQDTGAWARAQSFIESYQFPSDGTLMVLDEGGRLLCHPQLRRGSGLSRTDYGQMTVRVEGTTDDVPLASVRSERGVLLRGETDAGEIAMAMVHSQKLGAFVIARQSRAEMTASGQRLVEDVAFVSGVAALGILGACALGSFLIVRRYDSMIMRMNEQLSEEVVRQVNSGLKIRNAIIIGLAKLADHRDNDTGRHLERISRYCELLGRELRREFLEIDDVWLERLMIASTMHDIGKVGIPDSILLKPGALTLAERRIMERHPLIGADTLVEVRRHVGEDDLVDMGIDVALYHHERWDGHGYPFGLHTEEIPLCARIVALADVYDALTSKRVYKAAMPHEQAVRIILENRGTHLDPRIVDAFERVHEQFEATRQAMTDETFQLNLVSAREAA